MIIRVSILIAFQEDEPLVKVLSCNSILLILSVFFFVPSTYLIMSSAGEPWKTVQEITIGAHKHRISDV